MDWIINQLRQMSLIEWAGALTGFIGIYLTVKNRIENWPWSILSALLYGWVFWQGKLYANTALQILYFFPCCLYGWWVWAKCGPTQNNDLPVTLLTPRARIGWLLAGVALSLSVGYPIAQHTTDPHPYADSFTTGFSLVGQYLQAKKIYDNWWLWIPINLIYALYLMPVQQLWPSALLYAAFTILAVRGAIEWKPLIGKPVVHQ